MRPTRARLSPLVSLALAACGGEAEPQGTSAVLITLDTTNAAALDVYGPDRGITPALTALAREGIVFDRARTVAPLTLPAHASILTGLYPPRHTVRANGHLPLPEAADTVAERARAAGYRTAAFIAADVLSSPYGLDQGFDVYDEPVGTDAAMAGGIPERAGDEVTARAIEWLDSRQGDEPYFLWVHYFDPHAPYQPPPADRERAGGRAYLGEVAAMDRAIGALLERLAREPDHANTMIVAVSDHGEALGRHGEATHSLLVYDTTLVVPLIVRRADGLRRGERSQEVVSVVDLFPTLLEGMGLSVPAGVDGRSLLEPSESTRRGVYFEAYSGYLNYGWSTLAGWFDGERKYIHGSSPELFQIDVDGGEEHNLFDPGDGAVLRALEAIEHVSNRPRLSRRSEEALAVADEESLRALGYAGAASVDAYIPGPLEELDLPAPRDRMWEYDKVQSALRRVDDGDPEDAIRQLREITAGNPRHAFAHSLLGHFLLEAGRPAEAIVPLEAMIARGLDRPGLRQHLAAAYSQLGDLERAIEHLVKAEELCPGYPGAEKSRKRLERRLRRQQEDGE